MTMSGIIHPYNNFFFKNFRLKDTSLDLVINNRILLYVYKINIM